MRCLVVVISLALASGNAHAALDLDASADADPCLAVHGHEAAQAAPERDHAAAHHDKAHHDDGCCCQCLGCTTAMDLMPNLPAAPGAVALPVRFDYRTPALGTRALDPELDPPRPGALV